jgi:hypothetical protein
MLGFRHICSFHTAALQLQYRGPCCRGFASPFFGGIIGIDTDAFQRCTNITQPASCALCKHGPCPVFDVGG